MSGQQNQQQGAWAGAPCPNPFQSASIDRGFQGMKRAANSSSHDSPPKKKPANAELNVADYVQRCHVSDCERVLVNVGEKPVKFTLCKMEILHKSKFFRDIWNDAASKHNKEGQQKTIDLRHEDPKKFLLYISSMFPQQSSDLESVSFNNNTTSQRYKYTLTNLCTLFECVDRYGSLACSNIKQRILTSMESWRQIVGDSQLSWPVIEFLEQFSSRNMDLDADLLKALFTFDFNVADVETMTEIKPNILHQIMANSAAKLTKELAIQKEAISELKIILDTRCKDVICSNRRSTCTKFRVIDS